MGENTEYILEEIEYKVNVADEKITEIIIENNHKKGNLKITKVDKDDKTITLDNYIEIIDAVYIQIFLKSALIAIVTTLICILISYPFVLSVSHKSKRIQQTNL